MDKGKDSEIPGLLILKTLLLKQKAKKNRLQKRAVWLESG
jgi:hypothetical protein